MTWLRRALVALGAVIIVIAFRGVLTAISGPDLRHYFRYLLVGWLANDLLVLPVAISVGWLVSYRLPALAKPVVQGALLASLTAMIIAYPMIIGKAHSANNPSALPRDYGLGLAVTLGVIWLAAALLIAWRHQRRRHMTTAGGSAPQAAAASPPDTTPPASEDPQ